MYVFIQIVSSGFGVESSEDNVVKDDGGGQRKI